jgi:putative transposase
MVFEESRRDKELAAKEREMDSKYEDLLKTVGQLTVERDWLKKNQSKCLDLTTRKGLVRSRSDLTIERQCELLELNVSTYYYKPVEKTPEQLKRDEAIRNALDKWHTAMPYLGCRKLVTKLAEDGLKTHRKEVKKFMDEMGIYAVHPKPNLSKRNKKHKIYPYLLRHKAIFLPNQVWAVDITYIKLGHGHMYLTAIIDWYSRFIVGWALSDTLDTAPVLQAVEAAIGKYGTPSIINSDQGCQFTSDDYTGFLKDRGIRQSMDGKARWIDNVIIERWFRSLKYDDIYINEYNSPKELRRGIAAYVRDYNCERPHQSLGNAVPAKVYGASFKASLAA